MSTQYGETVTEISYLLGIYVLVLGTGPLIWNPFAQTLGRRPVVCSASSCDKQVVLSLSTVYCFNGCGTWWRNLGHMRAVVWVYGWRPSPSRFRAKCCTRSGRYHCGRHLSSGDQRGEDWMVDSHGSSKMGPYCEEKLIHKDNPWPVLGTDPSCVYCAGDRELDLDLRAPRHRFGGCTYFHVCGSYCMLVIPGML